MDVRISNQLPLAYAFMAGSSGKVSIPVPPSQLLYSNFKNVSGTPFTGAAAYTLDKLKILDTLIERLRTTRSQPELVREPQNLPDERIDALIQQYGNELHTALVSSASPYTRPAGVVPGMLLSVAA